MTKLWILILPLAIASLASASLTPSWPSFVSHRLCRDCSNPDLCLEICSINPILFRHCCQRAFVQKELEAEQEQDQEPEPMYETRRASRSDPRPDRPQLVDHMRVGKKDEQLQRRGYYKGSLDDAMRIGKRTNGKGSDLLYDLTRVGK